MGRGFRCMAAISKYMVKVLTNFHMEVANTRGLQGVMIAYHTRLLRMPRYEKNKRNLSQGPL